MKRRDFIQLAACALYIPYANALAVADAEAPAKAWTWARADRFFYDDRFPQAQRLAAKLSGSTELTPVQGDVTGLWSSGLGHACKQPMLILQGVTTESFHFCLKIMAGEQSLMETRVSRIDRDLFLWQMRCRQPACQEAMA